MRPFILLALLTIATFSYCQTKVHQVDESGEPHSLKDKFAPDFKAITLDDTEIALKNLTGKIVLLDFWSLSCAACFKELPELNELVNTYPQEKFVLISLMDNTKDEILEKFEVTDKGYKIKQPIFGNEKIDFQIIPDAKEIMKLFSQDLVFPQAFILDQNGIMTFYFTGYAAKRGIPGEVTNMDTREIDRLLNASYTQSSLATRIL